VLWRCIRAFPNVYRRSSQCDSAAVPAVVLGISQMRNVVGRRKFAPNPSEERWKPAFPVPTIVRINRLRCKKITVTFVCQNPRFSRGWVARFAQRSMVRTVKGIVAILMFAASLTIAACSWFGSSEAIRSESGRTVYRSAEETPLEVPEITPVPQKVPGETR
jgi:hypothetical protein